MIARKSTLIFGFNIISALLGYVGLFFVARFMGAYPLGIVGFAFAFVTTFSFIADLGFDGAHVKRISEGKELNKCLGTFFTIKAILVVVMATCILGSVFVWKFLLGRGFESREHELVLYIMLFYIVLWSFSKFFLITFCARQETAKFQIPYFTETFSRVLITIPIAVLGLGVIVLASSYVIGVVLMLLVSLWLFRNYTIGKYDKEYFRSYLSFALPVFFIIAISVIAVNIDTVMIQLFWSSKEVGYYFGVQKINNFVIMISGAVGALLFPTLSSYHAENKIKEIAILTQKAERYISLVIFPIIAFIIALAPQIIIVILSAEFLPAVTVLQTLALYTVLVSINSPYWLQFGAINLPKLGAKIAGTVALLNIALNMIFIPPAIFGVRFLGLGAFGAALTTVISACVGILISRFYVKKLTNTTTNPKIFIHLLVACLTALLLYLLAQTLPLDRFYSLILAGLLCVGIYLGILYCLREFTKEDYHFFLDTLSPKKMFRYIREELRQ
ncbi:MAG: flippase [Candidatus Thermoplasmatota archaeon]|nr:flippase [Candidatus Thermoplasmatota archaeon]